MTSISKGKQGKISKEDFLEKLKSLVDSETDLSDDESEKTIDKLFNLINQLKNSDEEEDIEAFLPAYNLHWLNKEDLKSALESKNTVDQMKSLGDSVVFAGKEEEFILDLNVETKSEFIEQLNQLIEDSGRSDEQIDTKLLGQSDIFEEKSLSEIKALLNDYIQENMNKQEIRLDAENENSENPEIQMTRTSNEGLEEFLVDQLPLEAQNADLKVNKKLVNLENKGFDFSSKEQFTEYADLADGIQPIDEMIEKSINSKWTLEEDSILNDVESSKTDLKEIEEQSSQMIEVNKSADKTESPIQKVSQKNFLSELKAIVFENEDLSQSNDKVTRARLQLTPENLGKVDLKIEMQGKELVARLIVEKNETKEWVEQQLSVLKEQLLSQDIQVKDFQVLVHKENMQSSFMDQQENPFFKQKEKETKERKGKQNYSKSEKIESQDQLTSHYSIANGVSIFA